MVIHFLKFFHLILVLGLLSSMCYCIALVTLKKFSTPNLLPYDNLKRLTKIILQISLFLMLTGTFLVYPKHYTFHTPWIQAAYILMIVFTLGVLILKNRVMKKKQRPVSRIERGVWQIGYILLFGILMLVIHDAVTKSTFLFL